MKLPRFGTRFLVAIAISLFSISPVMAQSPAQNGAKLAAALEAAQKGLWGEAENIARQNQDPIAVEIIEWHRLRDGLGKFEEYEAFLKTNSDWPGLPFLQKASEKSIPAGLKPERVIKYFQKQQPQSGWGALRLAQAYQAVGKNIEAQFELSRAWVEFSLKEDEQDALWSTYAKILRPHNAERLDMLLWKRKRSEAERMLPLVSSAERQLAEVRIALQRENDGVDKMISALPPESKNDAGLAYSRLHWRIGKGYWDSAQEMLVERSGSFESLGRPEFWADKRRAYARRAMRNGEHRTAYYLSSQHFLTPNQSGYSDLEWLSGFIALRKLNDPKRAILHFQNFGASAIGPISIGRAGYWLGRSYEALGDSTSARTAYAVAATYQTSFYGQLAAERAGLPPDQSIAAAEIPPDWTRESFLKSDSVRAGFLFHFAGEDLLTRRFLTHESETVSDVQRTALGQLALDLGSPMTALKIAKEAATNGNVVPLAYYPITELADFAGSVPSELALAIARQESEFNPLAESGAGAVGLMQVLPTTAELVTKKLGIAYDKRRLKSDWQYNATIGTAYLADMLERFDGSTLLAAAAYNAGPLRAERWIKDFGDPRSSNVDVIDWIETIPYRETRNYVMRVNEALFVYRARLTGVAPPLNLSISLNGG